MRATRMILAILGGLACVAAGVFLLISQSQAASNSYDWNATMPDVIAHGIGLYAVGRGLWMIGDAFRRDAPPAAAPLPLPPA
jgi:hypothetical protein